MDIDWDHLIHTLGTDRYFDASETHLVPPVHPEWNYPPAALSSPSSTDTSQDQRESSTAPDTQQGTACQREVSMPSPPQSQPQREASLPSMPNTPVPSIKDDATVLGTQDYELKYKEAPLVLPDHVPSFPYLLLFFVALLVLAKLISSMVLKIM
eukprot:3659563-Ditylum_brightwellii.AAC.1